MLLIFLLFPPSAWAAFFIPRVCRCPGGFLYIPPFQIPPACKRPLPLRELAGNTPRSCPWQRL
nr:MAG TPA: hypothetical protein [Caudoviricetes sp.]